MARSVLVSVFLVPSMSFYFFILFPFPCLCLSSFSHAFLLFMFFPFICPNLSIILFPKCVLTASLFFPIAHAFFLFLSVLSMNFLSSVFVSLSTFFSFKYADPSLFSLLRLPLFYFSLCCSLRFLSFNFLSFPLPLLLRFHLCVGVQLSFVPVTPICFTNLSLRSFLLLF